MPKKCRSHFFHLVFWHNQYIAPPKFCQAVCLERNPVCWSIFIQTWKSRWHLSTSWRNKIILSAVYRVSSPAVLPVPPHRDEWESLSTKRGSRVNRGVVEQIYSGLSEIQLFKLISLFTLVLMLWKAMAYHLVTRGRGLFLCFPRFFSLNLFSLPSFIATLV